MNDLESKRAGQHGGPMIVGRWTPARPYALAAIVAAVGIVVSEVSVTDASLLAVFLARWLGGLGAGWLAVGLIGIHGTIAPAYLLHPVVGAGRYGPLTFCACSCLMLLTIAQGGLRRARLVTAEIEAPDRDLFGANPHPMWIFDAETLRFLEVNDSAVNRYGYSREEFLAMRITDIRPAEDVARLVERVESHRETPYLGESPWTHRKRDGTTIEVEIVSHAIRFRGRPARLVLANDVTARRRAERELRFEAERLDLALDAAELGLWYRDLPDGPVGLNERAREHLGIPPGDWPSPDVLFDRIHPDDRDSTRRAVERAIAEGTPFEVEYRVALADGRVRWIGARGRTSHDAAGRPARFDGVSMDVTEAKRAEAALIAAREAAIAANQAKDKFLAVLGHELRTPLAPILSAVSAILDGDSPVERTGADAAIRETLGMIRRNVELETRLIGDLLDITRIERGLLQVEPARMDLHAAILEAMEVCRDAIRGAGLVVQIALDAEAPEVFADHDRVMQIVWNILMNASKFSEPGGSLTIRSRNVTGTGDESGPRVIVEFEDDGIGISPEALRRIFDPFEREATRAGGSRNGHGLGLGLAISRALAEAMGGRLTATSPGPGLGSTFRLGFPGAPPRPGGIPGEGEAGRGLKSEGGPRRILLVEDNGDTLRFLALLLRHRGYEVATAGGVESALAIAASSDFDILISDIELADGCGLDLMRSLRGSAVGIAISGFGAESDVAMSLDAGFSAHLTKPLDFARIEDAIRGVIAPNAPAR